MADPWADDPVKNWRAAHAYTILKFNRVPEFLEENSETLESFLVEVTADLESRFGNPELAPWPVEERVVSKADGDTAEANQDQADLDGVAAEEAVLLDAAGEPLIDPITIDQAAVLLWLDVKTIRNKGKKGRPNAAIPASGNKSARYRYREFRPWLAAKFPKEADRLPESYEEAKNIFSVVVSDSDDD